jgi:hypothetical protein
MESDKRKQLAHLQLAVSCCRVRGCFQQLFGGTSALTRRELHETACGVDLQSSSTRAHMESPTCRIRFKLKPDEGLLTFDIIPVSSPSLGLLLNAICGTESPQDVLKS